MSAGKSFAVGQQAKIVLEDSAGNEIFGTSASAALGKVGGISDLIQSVPVLSVGGAAATGDYVGTSVAPQAFAGAVRAAGGTGVVQSLTITDKLTTTPVALELWLFNDTFTAPTDNAAWAISDADQQKCIGVIELPAANWYANGNGYSFSKTGIGQVIKCVGTALYYAIVARGTTPAWASGAGGSLEMKLGVLQD